MVKKIAMNLNDTLELDYLVEQVSDDAIDITSEPTPGSSSIQHAKKRFGIFNPSETGIHKLKIDGQTIKIRVIPNGAVSRWTFDNTDTDTENVIDIWGSNNATNNGATTGVTGANETYSTNEAFSFDGSNDYVDTTIESITPPVSISLWCYLTDTGGTYGAFGNWNNTDAEDLYIQYTDTESSWRLNTDSGVVLQPSQSFSTNTWQHIVFTIDANKQSGYFDGNRVASSTTGTTATHKTVNNFAIGGTSSSKNLWNGRIDDVRIYEKALSATEVSNLYNTGSING